MPETPVSGTDESLLVLNAGSSSLKFAVFRQAPGAKLHRAISGQLSGIGQGKAQFAVRAATGEALDWAPPGRLDRHDAAIDLLADRLALRDHPELWRGIGHRIVHGGREFVAPLRLDAAHLARLETLIPLAPLHQPHNLAAIRRLMELAPSLPQIACFDTAFHAGQPELATTLALPARFAAMGVRRYGFHGLSYESILAALPNYLGFLPDRLIVAHLGNGASLAAIAKGRSIATSMGFSTLDGLVMGTRPGALDPGVLLFLLREAGLDAAGLENLLYRESGLLALSESSADMRSLLAAEARDPRAAFAIASYCYRIRREIGSHVAALGGLDALVFTGGIGENAAPIRAAICAELGWLGIAIDPARNAAQGPDLAAPESRVGLWAIPTDEEGIIAGHMRQWLDPRTPADR